MNINPYFYIKFYKNYTVLTLFELYILNILTNSKIFENEIANEVVND